MAATHVAEGIGAVQVPRVPTQLFIDGTWRDAADGATFDVVAPASEEHLATVAAAGEADVDAAVRAARAQVDGGEWATMHGRDRGMLLYRLADAIEREIDTLATLEALDIGRPAFEPKMVDLPHVVDVFRHFAGWADKIEGRWVTPAPFFGMTRQAYTIREPRRRGRRDRRVERAHADRVLEARPRARGRQRRRPQAGGGRVAVDAVPRQAHRGGRLPGRRRQRRPRPGRGRRAPRSSATPASTS